MRKKKPCKPAPSEKNYIDDDGEVAEVDVDWFRTADWGPWPKPPPREAISLRLPPDVLAWYRKQGRGYQTRMQRVLEIYAGAQAGAESDAKRARKTMAKAAVPATAVVAKGRRSR